MGSPHPVLEWEVVWEAAGQPAPRSFEKPPMRPPRAPGLAGYLSLDHAWSLVLKMPRVAAMSISLAPVRHTRWAQTGTVHVGRQIHAFGLTRAQVAHGASLPTGLASRLSGQMTVTGPPFNCLAGRGISGFT